MNQAAEEVIDENNKRREEAAAVNKPKTANAPSGLRQAIDRKKASEAPVALGPAKVDSEQLIKEIGEQIWAEVEAKEDEVERALRTKAAAIIINNELQIERYKEKLGHGELTEQHFEGRQTGITSSE